VIARLVVITLPLALAAASAMAAIPAAWEQDQAPFRIYGNTY
jgi:hypothetical protein